MSDSIDKRGKFRMEVTPTEAVLHIDGFIGSADFWGDYSAAKLRRELASIAAPNLTVNINSGGGEVFEGMAIFDALKASGKTITTRAVGWAASIASVIFMAGSKRVVADGSFVVIHNAWSLSVGDANAMRKDADVLDKITAEIRAVYTAATGMADADLAALMNAETWMNRADAIAKGFATAEPAPTAFAAFDKARYFAALSGFRNVPACLISTPTAGVDAKTKNTTTMSEQTPAGKPRNEVSDDAFAALTQRVTDAEAATAKLAERVTALETSEADAKAQVKTLDGTVKAQASELAAIKASTPANAAQKPPAVPPVASKDGAKTHGQRAAEMLCP